MGDNVETYSDGMGHTKVIHHEGRQNIIAYLNRLVATMPAPGKLVVSGSSAGGFGSALNYDLIRSSFNATSSYLIDDSGPPLIGDAIPATLRQAWYAAWRLDLTLSPLCPDCENDFSTLVPILAAKYPKDRMTLLSHNQDAVIRSFFGNQSASQFETELYSVASTLLDPLPNFHYYISSGTGHTYLYTPGATFVKGVWLLSFISQMVNDNSKWVSIMP